MGQTGTPAEKREFRALADLIGSHARSSPDRLALSVSDAMLDYAALDRMMDRVAVAFQRDGANPGNTVAFCGRNSVAFATVFLGALRAGLVPVPIAPSVTADQFGRMLRDCGAAFLFRDETAPSAATDGGLHTIALGTGSDDSLALDDWLAPAGVAPAPVTIEPSWPCNVIYSSGTTGTPKGIVQSHGMRWAQVLRGVEYGYGASSRMLLATPFYSNTTLVAFFPTLAWGGSVYALSKFDVRAYLETAQSNAITHTMLVPVQYQRLMASPAFDDYDLSSFEMKFCTSAPFAPELKRDVIRRWPGGLIEIYGMTEGGGACVLRAHDYPDKLHTVGSPASGHEFRILGDDDRPVADGEAGEVAGHSPSMMIGYRGRPALNREIEWFDAEGKRFFRTGDIGRFDEDGFMVIVDRKKDMIISGGFNIYPSDLEAELCRHEAVAEAAVIGVPSAKWGESPVAYVVVKPGSDITEDTLLDWCNARVGAVQRLVALRFIDALPRSAIGKLAKGTLREQYLGSA